MERIPLHSWEMEFSIQYHVTVKQPIKRSEFNKVLYNSPYLINDLSPDLSAYPTLPGENPRLSAERWVRVTLRNSH